MCGQGEPLVNRQIDTLMHMTENITSHKLRNDILVP